MVQTELPIPSPPGSNLPPHRHYHPPVPHSTHPCAKSTSSDGYHCKSLCVQEGSGPCTSSLARSAAAECLMVLFGHVQQLGACFDGAPTQ